VRELDLAAAQAGLEELIEDALAGKPCVITRDGQRVALLVGYDGWLSAMPSFGALLMSAPIEPGDIPERDQTPPRDVEF